MKRSRLPAKNAKIEQGFRTPKCVPQRFSKTVFAGTIGNVIEWFDWSMYTTFAVFFGKQFFPSDSETGALLATLAVFALGFCMRPLGGWLIGGFSDRFGRRRALILTVTMMSSSSLAMGLLPTYASIGVFAPVLMTSLRMVQGLAVGGEYGAATAFLVESAPAHRRGLYGSFLFFSIAAGLLMASCLADAMVHFMSRTKLEAWGWRIPFIIGGCGSLLGFWMRRNLPETQAFETLKSSGDIQPRSIHWIWLHHRNAILRLVGISVLGAFSFYMFVSFVPIYAIRTLGARPAEAFSASSTSIAIFMLAQPLFGAMSDKFGRRPQLIVFALAYLALLYPVLTSLNSDYRSMLLVECFGLLLYGLYSAIAPAIMVELFDTGVRGIGIGSTYNIVVALVGGTTPYLMTKLVSLHQERWFFIFVSLGALLSLITFFKMPETRGIPIE